MKSKKIIIAIISLLIILIPISVLGNTLTLKISTDKEDLKIGDMVTVKVYWDKEVQAADFSLKYDSKKLEYVKSDIDDVYINNKEGELKTAWVSMDNTDRTYIEYIFKIKKGGSAKFSTNINGGFANGDLVIFDNYNNNDLTIKIQQNYTAYIIVAIVIMFIILIYILKKGGIFKKR